MQALRVLLVLLLLLIPLRSDAAECLPHKEMLPILFKGGYAWVSTAVTDQRYVIQLFINLRTDEWLIIMVDNDMHACIVVNGDNWMNTIERAI